MPISTKVLEYQRQLAISQRYQVYATNAEFLANNEQQLITAVVQKEYEPPTAAVVVTDEDE